MARKRKPCPKPHVEDLLLGPITSTPMRHTKTFGGDTYINGYAVVAMLSRIGLHKHGAHLGERLADIQKES